MATAYIITNTAKTASFTMPPKTVSGPTQVNAILDVTLHGPGAITWGKALDENFIRLTENFACPEEGDTNKPQTSMQLGNGSGVNKPIEGQLWFNTSKKTMMAYNGVSWDSLGKPPLVQPANPSIGDLWYDAAHYDAGTAFNAGFGQMMVFDTNGWQRLDQQLKNATTELYLMKAGDTMTGMLTLHDEPTIDKHAATKKYVDDQVHNLTTPGGYVPYKLTSKPLELGDGVGLGFDDHNFGIYRGSHAAAAAHIMAGVSSEARNTEQGTNYPQFQHHIDRSGASLLAFDATGRDGQLRIHVANQPATDNAPIHWNRIFTFQDNGLDMGGGAIWNLADPQNGFDAATKSYVDNTANNKVSKAGDTMTGILYIKRQGTCIHIRGTGNQASSQAWIDIVGGEHQRHVGRIGDAGSGSSNLDVIAYHSDLYLKSEYRDNLVYAHRDIKITAFNGDVPVTGTNVRVWAGTQFTSNKPLKQVGSTDFDYDPFSSFVGEWKKYDDNYYSTMAYIDGTGIVHFDMHIESLPNHWPSYWDHIGWLKVKYRPTRVQRIAVQTGTTAARRIIYISIDPTGAVYAGSDYAPAKHSAEIRTSIVTSFPGNSI